jgi:hypothetical protein
MTIIKRGWHCTFHTLLREYNLTAPVLKRIASIIDEADVAGSEVMVEPGFACPSQPQSWSSSVSKMSFSLWTVHVFDGDVTLEVVGAAPTVAYSRSLYQIWSLHDDIHPSGASVARTRFFTLYP